MLGIINEMEGNANTTIKKSPNVPELLSGVFPKIWDAGQIK